MLFSYIYWESDLRNTTHLKSALYLRPKYFRHEGHYLRKDYNRTEHMSYRKLTRTCKHYAYTQKL
jgi:hypothetical protein